MFGTTQPIVSDTVKSVREALLLTVVPENLGIFHITREDCVKNLGVEFFNNVFEKSQDVLPLVLDATSFI